MALSLAIIIILGLIFNRVFEKIKLPGILGMLFLGVIIGPYVLNLINEDIIKISPDLRKIALIVILLRAGIGIKKDTLKEIGRTALKMSCIPCICEGVAIAAVGKFIEAGMLGFIIAAVSPAVVVPQMLGFISRSKGTNKGIPTIILAATSIDDVFAITIFSTFLGFYGGENINVTWKLVGIPISIILGLLAGGVIGIVLTAIFKKYRIRDTKKTLILLAVAIMLTGVEDLLKDIVPIASLLGVMTIGFILLEKYPKVANRLAERFNRIWVFAEIILFVLVGAEVNINVVLHSGLLGLVVLTLGLIARSIGVFISLIGTNLNIKERLFCVISFLPKATVQAAMGSVPLAAGVASGEVILAISVLAIVVTAPLGALGIKYTGGKWLKVD